MDHLRRKLAHLRTVGGADPLRVVARAAALPLERAWAGGRALPPLAVTLEITHRCNLDCNFCFLHPDLLNGGGRELSEAEARSVVRQASALGAGLFVTGGEPLLRDDLPGLVALARARGSRCGINTNGTLLASRRGRALLDAEPTYLLVSPHSLDADTASGRAERAGLAAAADHPAHRAGRTRILLNGVLSGGAVEPLLALARELGLDGATFQHPTFFTPAQRRAHAEAWVAAMGEPDPGLSGPDALVLPPPPPPLPEAPGLPVWTKPDLGPAETARWYGGADAPEGARDGGGETVEARCHYPRTDLRVTPSGDVVFCQLIPRPLGNVRRATLREIWNGPEARRLRRGFDRAGGSLPGCSRCCKLYRASGRPSRRSRSSSSTASTAAAGASKVAIRSA